MNQEQHILPLIDVTSMYQETCNAIQSIDQNIICLIRPSQYYNICHLNSTIFINSTTGNVLYTFDFFTPYECVNVQLTPPLTYPMYDNMPCCTLCCGGIMDIVYLIGGIKIIVIKVLHLIKNGYQKH